MLTVMTSGAVPHSSISRIICSARRHSPALPHTLSTALQSYASTPALARSRRKSGPACPRRPPCTAATAAILHAADDARRPRKRISSTRCCASGHMPRCISACMARSYSAASRRAPARRRVASAAAASSRCAPFRDCSTSRALASSSFAEADLRSLHRAGPAALWRAQACGPRATPLAGERPDAPGSSGAWSKPAGVQGEGDGLSREVPPIMGQLGRPASKRYHPTIPA
mmetsp:Transcript_82728/g.246775  ORF Transcript_82728/g.246775 Transcript_82728/m.246775 type:complete len:229 (-) Transcript_82728:11-697(-)